MLIRAGMRAAFTVLTLALALSAVHAAEPLRLQVIPFREAGQGNTRQPVHRFEGELKAPPTLNVPRAAKPSRKRRRRWTRGGDHDWLMD